MSKKDFWITVIVSILCVALIVGIIIVKRSEGSTPVAHDHNGDGIPDHGDEAHTTTPTTATTPSATAPANGENEEDTDISVDIEDLPQGAGSN